MKKILLFEKKSLYRDSMKVYGYLFGAGDLDKKTDSYQCGTLYHSGA